MLPAEERRREVDVHCLLRAPCSVWTAPPQIVRPSTRPGREGRDDEYVGSQVPGGAADNLRLLVPCGFPAVFRYAVGAGSFVMALMNATIASFAAWICSTVRGFKPSCSAYLSTSGVIV